MKCGYILWLHPLSCSSYSMLHRMDTNSETIEFICQILISFFFLRWSITRVNSLKTAKPHREKKLLRFFVFNVSICGAIFRKIQWVNFWQVYKLLSALRTRALHTFVYGEWICYRAWKSTFDVFMGQFTNCAACVCVQVATLFAAHTHNEKRDVFAPKINCT